MNPDEKNTLIERYDWAVKEFFQGKDYWDTNRKTIGHIWVEKHRAHVSLLGKFLIAFETLTIEPPEGGQYEVAVRIKDSEDEEGEHIIYRGYKADNGFLRGVNTGGH
jgi:hypothetical protein